MPYTLVPSLAGNTSFDQVYIEAGTISSGTLALNLIGNNANMSYVFASAFTVAAGATMAVGPNVMVLANSESTLSDAGAMTFSSGDQVTLTFTAISVSGGLTANGTDFINGNGGSNITFGSTATLGGGTNTFDLPIYVPYTLVPSLAGNTSFDQVYIEAGTISSGTLALNLIGNNANMSYVFASAFTVAAGGTMAVGANVMVLANSESTFSDAGAMTFSSGDQVTLTFTAISVSGGLTANGTDFINGNGGEHHLRLDRDPRWRHQHLRLADLRALHARPLARGQHQLRPGLHRGGHDLQRHPGAQPDRQQREHELCVRLRLHRGRRRDDGGRRERDSLGEFGVDAQRRGGHDLLQRRPGDVDLYGDLRQRGPDRQRHRLHQRQRRPNITFGSTATLAGGTNTFDLPIYVPYTLVPSLAGNTSFDQVYIEAGTISSGTLALNLIGNNANMSYVFASAFTVAAGATMAVGANVIVLANRSRRSATRGP